MLTLLDFCDDDNGRCDDGDRLRDLALDRLRAHRPTLVRRLMRAFLAHLLDNPDDTSDALRALVPIPAGTDPRVVGSAVRGLAELKLTTSVGRRKTLRGVAHAGKLDVWRVADAAKARHWLATHADDHPDQDPPSDGAVPAPLTPPAPSGSACTSASC
jgi:hypothetical protein